MVTKGAIIAPITLTVHPPHVSSGRRERRRLRPVPVSRLQDTQGRAGARFAEAYVPNQQSKHVGPVWSPGGIREETCHGQGWTLGLPPPPRGGSPWAGLAWPAWPGEELPPRCWRHLASLLASPLSRERGPCPPPGAGGLCSLAPVPGGRLPARCKTGDRPVCPLGPRTRPVCSWRGSPGPILVEGLREGLVLSSQSRSPQLLPTR